MVNRLIKLFLFIVPILLSGCKDNYSIVNGLLLNHTAGEYIKLDQLKSDKLVATDSVKVSSDGTFSFRFKPLHSSFYLLKFNNNNFLMLLVDPENEIFIRAHRDSLNFPELVEGSEGTIRMAEYNRKLNQTIDHLKALNKVYESNEGKTDMPALMDSLDSLARNYLTEINSYTKNYIDNNINSLVSLVALYQQVAPGVPVLDRLKDWQYFARVDSSLYRQYPDYEPVITLHKEVQEIVSALGVEAEAPGSSLAVAPEISLPDTRGDTISLSSTRGSVVLLDFWAAWCPPCRKENPNLVKAYDLYHRKGFQIFQVSLDKTKEAWIKGIQDDKLQRWIHVSDLKYWNSSVVPQYKIDAIPTNFLLDREGKIIASNLRGEALQNKLAEVFNEK